MKRSQSTPNFHPMETHLPHGATYFLPHGGAAVGVPTHMGMYTHRPAMPTRINRPVVPKKKLNTRQAPSFFIGPEMARHFEERSASRHAQLDPSDIRCKYLPRMIQHYHSFFPLDSASRDQRMHSFGYPSTLWKCISTADGLCYAMRRIDGFFLRDSDQLNAAGRWMRLHHPNVVPLRDVFISKDFENIHGVYFVYDFCPGSQTLEERYFSKPGALIPENVLASYMVQLCGALQTIHHAGLACRVLDASKILIQGRNRLKINAVGVLDVVHYDSTLGNLGHFQREDLLALGRLLFSLACRNPSALEESFDEGMKRIASTYSADIQNLLMTLLKSPASPSYPTIDVVCAGMVEFTMREMEYLHGHTDALESSLEREMENGRLFRLLLKLEHTVHMPNFADPASLEAVHRHLLQLYTEHLFDQVRSDGETVVDLAHVVESLNKLDAGTEEKLLLMGRDEKIVLITSYKELKRAADSLFKRLTSRNRRDSGTSTSSASAASNPRATAHASIAHAGAFTSSGGGATKVRMHPSPAMGLYHPSGRKIPGMW